VAAPGTRAWINGLTLCGTGVQQLDALFGGGVPLSSLLLLRSDLSGVHARSFVASFVAEGVSRLQPVLHVSADPRASQREWLANACPRNVTLEREAANQADAEAAVASAAASGAAARGDDDAASSSARGSDLKIAWRYTQYLDRPMDAKTNLGAHKQTGGGGGDGGGGGSSSSSSSRSSSSSSSVGATLSCSYDYRLSLSSRMMGACPPTVLSIGEDIVAQLLHASNNDDDLEESAAPVERERRNRSIYCELLKRIAAFLEERGCVAPSATSTSNSGPVCRVVLHGLGGLGWHEDAEHAVRPLLLFLGHLRQLLWNRRAVALLSVPAGLHPSSSAGRLMAHASHASLSLASFADAAGGAGVQAVALQALGDYDGLLRLEKAPALHALAPALGVAAHVAPQEGGATAAAAGGGSNSTSSFLYKCARRRILIEKFALPPEMDEAAASVVASSSSSGSTPAEAMAHEHAARASKPASVRSTRPPPPASASSTPGGVPAAASASRGRIELGLEEEDDDEATSAAVGSSLRASGATLSRRPGVETGDDRKPDPRRAKAHAQNDTLQSIVRGRATGCSGTHQLPGKMDF
jgi:hypothetical protein